MRRTEKLSAKRCSGRNYSVIAIAHVNSPKLDKFPYSAGSVPVKSGLSFNVKIPVMNGRGEYFST